jgi:hypothetical protein
MSHSSLLWVNFFRSGWTAKEHKEQGNIAWNWEKVNKNTGKFQAPISNNQKNSNIQIPKSNK